MLTLTSIQKSYGSLTVLADVTFALGDGQCAALVGYNGTGKTTILKIISGLVLADSGSVQVGPHERIGYLPQDTSLASNLPLLEYLREAIGIGSLERELTSLSDHLTEKNAFERYGVVAEEFERLGGFNIDHRIKTMLEGFGLAEIDTKSPVSRLSSGQKNKIEIITLLLREDDVLLLDEPTNNLDLPSVIWLEEFLNNSKKTILIVSHDRRFIDRISSKIIELDWLNRKTTVTHGNYTDYLNMKERRLQNQIAAFSDQKEEISRLKDRAASLRRRAAQGARWSGTDNDKFLRGFKRDRAAGSARGARAIDQRIEQLDRIERPHLRNPLEIDVTYDLGEGNRDIILENVVTGYNNGHYIGPISLNIPFGSRIGIMGLNGTGKTTLLRTITRQISPLTGHVHVGSDVRIGNMLQEHDTLPRDMSPIDFLLNRCGLIEEPFAYHLLARFNITNHEKAKDPISTLSPGARARLLIALFSTLKCNVLILDEPTNHLDLEATEALEEAVSSFKGTVILVSHDRFFIESSKLKKLYLIDNNQISELNNFSDYLELAKKKAIKLLRSI